MSNKVPGFMRDWRLSQVRMETFRSARPEVEGRSFSGVACPYNRAIEGASQPSVIARGAFKKSVTDRRGQAVRLLAHHDPSHVLGTVTSLEDTDAGLRFSAKLTAGVREADEMLQLLASKAVTHVSVGFDVLEFRKVKVSDLHTLGVDAESVRFFLASGLAMSDTVRVVTQARLHEISCVGLAASDHAVIERVGFRTAAQARTETMRLRLQIIEAALSSADLPGVDPLNLPGIK